MVRIDPLNEAGQFDSTIFASNSYDVLITRLKKYLRAEGFITSPGEYIITLPLEGGPASWLVVVS